MSKVQNESERFSRQKKLPVICLSAMDDDDEMTILVLSTSSQSTASWCALVCACFTEHRTTFVEIGRVENKREREKQNEKLHKN